MIDEKNKKAERYRIMERKCTVRGREGELFNSQRFFFFFHWCFYHYDIYRIYIP